MFFNTLILKGRQNEKKNYNDIQYGNYLNTNFVIIY